MLPPPLSLLPLRRTAPPLRLPARAPVALGVAPGPPTIAATSAAAAKAVAALAAVAVARGRAPLLVTTSSTPPASSSSSLLPVDAGPATTIPGRAPSRCGPEAPALRWRRSRCPLIYRRNSSRRSSRSSSSRHLSPTARLLLLHPTAPHTGSPPGTTTLWSAFPPRIRRRLPPLSVPRPRLHLSPVTGTSTQVLPPT